MNSHSQSSNTSLPYSGLACIPHKHKERYAQKATLTPKEPNHPLTKPKSNNDTPRAELDKLAKAWCELVLGFMQERKLQTHAQGSKEEEMLENIK